MPKPMQPVDEGLRCQDVHAGLRNVDPNSGALAVLEDTRVIGMAASLAASIRGREIIADAQALKSIAAEQLDVDPLAYETVLHVLHDAGFIAAPKLVGGKTRAFDERVPFHQDLYSTLGEAWRARQPGEEETALVVMVDRLAHGPVVLEELAGDVGLDDDDTRRLVQLAGDAEIIKRVLTTDGTEMVYSPFLGFENPELISDLIEQHGSDRFQEEFSKARDYQGLPIDAAAYPVLNDAVAHGLLLGSIVKRPDTVDQTFVSLPYIPDKTLLTVRKVILDKALAIVSCVRCGQHFGGVTNLSSPVAVINKLLRADADHTLGSHSSSARQYQLLQRMQIVEYLPGQYGVKVRLRATEDNLEAARLARDLLTWGQSIENRVGGEAEVQQLLGSNEVYQGPMQTTARVRRSGKKLTNEAFGDLIAALMDRG